MRHALAALLLLAGCGVLPEAPDPRARILVMGDSILSWNRGSGAGVADAIEKRLGQPVTDASVPGARMRPGDLRAALGLSIPAQYRAGDWDVVVLNGGANDLLGTCGCTRCDAVLDRLARRDYPALIARLAPAHVVIPGYYGPVEGGGGLFDICSDELAELGRRLARLAATDPRVDFVPLRATIAGRPRYYDVDRVHPSPEGSALIGALLTREIAG